jgi:hypothetical protein
MDVETASKTGWFMYGSHEPDCRCLLNIGEHAATPLHSKPPAAKGAWLWYALPRIGLQI